MFKYLIYIGLVAIVCAAPQVPVPVPVPSKASSPSSSPSSDATAEVNNYSDEINPDGSFAYKFDTSNGINIQESGLANGTVQGTIQYQSPEGEQIQLTYIADENGFQPSGSHLPTPPPVPETIVKALEYLRAHPPPEAEEVTKAA